MLKQLVKMVGLIVAAAVAQHYANIFAFMERGYDAVGGEIFIFPMVLILGGMALGLIKFDDDVDDEGEMEDDYYDESDEESDFFERFLPKENTGSAIGNGEARIYLIRSGVSDDFGVRNQKNRIER